MEREGRGHLALFAYYYPPLGGAGSQRALSWARHLPPLGWRVTVFTPRDGVYGIDASLAAGDLPGVEVVRTASLEVAALLRKWRPGAGGEEGGGKFVQDAPVGPVGAALRGLARRFLYFPDSARGWVRPAAAAALEAHRRDPFDVVLSTSPPLSGHLAAHRFARATGVPSVLEFRDLPRGAVVDPGCREARLVRGLAEHARSLVTVSPTCARWIDALAGHGRTRVVFNGFEPSSGGRTPGGDGRPVLLYAGSTYADRQDFRGLLRAMAELREAGEPWILRFAGRMDPETRERTAPFRDAGVLVEEGFVERQRVLELQAAAAVVLVWAWENSGAAGAGEDPVGMGQVPAKMFEAVPSGRPILLVASPGSDAEAVGRRLGLEAVAHADLEGMKRRLREVAAGRVPAGMKADPGALDGFTREAQAGVLAGILVEAASAASRA